MMRPRINYYDRLVEEQMAHIDSVIANKSPQMMPESTINKYPGNHLPKQRMFRDSFDKGKSVLGDGVLISSMIKQSESGFDNFIQKNLQRKNLSTMQKYASNNPKYDYRIKDYRTLDKEYLMQNLQQQPHNNVYE